MGARKQNLTLSLDKEILQKAKVATARRGISLSGFISKEINRLANSEGDYERAKREAIRLMGHAKDHGGNPAPRAALYDRYRLR